jgi:hypothetical protein
MRQTDQNQQHDEAVWQAWIKKNKAQDKFRFARRVKVMRFAVVFLLAGALLWRFTS